MKSKEKEYRAAYWVSWRKAHKPYAIKRCCVCGNEFSFRKDQCKRNRCEKCRHLVCLQCERPFTPKTGRYSAKFCSLTCKNNYQKQHVPEQLERCRGVKPRTYHISQRNKHGSAMDRDWRSSIFLRDNYTCQTCGKHGGRLQAHHIKDWRRHPSLRHDTKNGITLCVPCHQKTDTYGGRNARRMAQEVLAL